MFDRLTFSIRSAGDGPRTYPHDVGPRRLPDTLLEFAVGGGWQVDDLESGQTLIVPSGRVVVVPSERRHTMRMTRGTPMQSYWMMLALEDGIGRDVLMQLSSSFILSAAVSARVRRSVNGLARGPGVSLAAAVAHHRLGLDLAASIVRHAPPSAEKTLVASTRLDPVLRFIHDNLHRPLTRSDLAAAAHLSPTRFHYVFVRATGQSPVNYLMAQRVRRARQLLLSTDLSCKDVGARCGLLNAAHFSRVFTRWVNVGPSAYRRHALPR